MCRNSAHQRALITLDPDSRGINSRIRSPLFLFHLEPFLILVLTFLIDIDFYFQNFLHMKDISI